MANFCSKCGNRIDDSQKFCQACGASLMIEGGIPQARNEVVAPSAEILHDNEKPNSNMSKTSFENAEVKKKKSKGKLLAVIIIGAIAILIAFAIFDGSGDKSGKNDNDSVNSGGENSEAFQQLCSFLKDNGDLLTEENCYYIEKSGDGCNYVIAYTPDDNSIQIMRSISEAEVTQVLFTDNDGTYACGYSLALYGETVCKAMAMIPAREFSASYSLNLDFSYLNNSDMKDMYQVKAVAVIDELLKQTNSMIADSGLTMKDFGFVNY